MCRTNTSRLLTSMQCYILQLHISACEEHIAHMRVIRTHTSIQAIRHNGYNKIGAYSRIDADRQNTLPVTAKGISSKQLQTPITNSNSRKFVKNQGKWHFWATETDLLFATPTVPALITGYQMHRPAMALCSAPIIRGEYQQFPIFAIFPFQRARIM